MGSSWLKICQTVSKWHFGHSKPRRNPSRNELIRRIPERKRIFCAAIVRELTYCGRGGHLVSLAPLWFDDQITGTLKSSPGDRPPATLLQPCLWCIGQYLRGGAGADEEMCEGNFGRPRGCYDQGLCQVFQWLGKTIDYCFSPKCYLASID